MSDRRTFRREVLVPLFIAFMGFAAFSNVAGSPGFEAMRAVDVVRLIASEACFGAAPAALLIFFAGPRSG